MGKKNKVLFLETGTQGGGSFVSLYQYLNTNDNSQFSPVVCFLNRTPFVEKIEALGISVHLLRDPLYAKAGVVRLMLRAIQRMIELFTPKFRLSFDALVHKKVAKNLSKLLRNEEIDLLVTNVQIDRDLFAALLAHDLNIPVVSHLRSCFGEGFSVALARQANEKVSAFIANSASTRTYWIHKGLEPSLVSVVHNAVADCDLEPADLEKELGVPRSSLVICCVGRLVHIKGQDLLIKALEKLSKEFPSAYLIFVGGGNQRANLEKLSINCGIGDRVIFAGWRQDALSVVSASSVLVVPSREEPFGRVVIEGMLAKVPVVATRVGGIPEIITDQSNGLLVDPEDVDALCAAIRQVFLDSGLASRIVDSGIRTAREKFSIDAYSEKVNAIYSKALNA